MQDNKPTISFIKSCLKSEGYSKELITYLLSTYDLNTWINENGKNKLELATGFLAHARHIQQAASNY
jgi:hypothetical protein